MQDGQTEITPAPFCACAYFETLCRAVLCERLLLCLHACGVCCFVALLRKSDLRFERFITGTNSQRMQTCINRPADVRFGSASLARMQRCGLLSSAVQSSQSSSRIALPTLQQEGGNTRGGNSETGCDVLTDDCASPLCGRFDSSVDAHSPRCLSPPLLSLLHSPFTPHSPLHSDYSLFGKDEDGLQCYTRRRRNVVRRNGAKHSPLADSRSLFSRGVGCCSTLKLLENSLSARRRMACKEDRGGGEVVMERNASRLSFAGSRPLSRLTQQQWLLDPPSFVVSSARMGVHWSSSFAERRST